MSWFKRYWGHLVAGLAAFFGLVMAIITLGRVRPKPPPVPRRPELDDVDIPKPPPVDTTPSDDYEAEKEAPKTNPDSVIDDINRRHG